MPKFYPPEPGRSTPSSERKVWSAFEQLDAEWHVFHSVVWQAPRAGRQGDGEADFILLHARHGLLAIEVKGGGIELESGQWYSTDRKGARNPIKDPLRQVVDSKHALLRYLQHVPGLRSVPRICHAVIFPDVVLTAGIGLNPRDIVIDGEDLSSIKSSLERVLRHWEQWGATAISSRDVELLVGLLAPTFVVRGTLRADIAQTERQIVTLTERQVEALGMLRSVRHCIIRGGAGTGKTLLAVEKARRLATEGARALLICFNAPLAAEVSQMLRESTSVTVSTFHSLCMRLGGKSKVPVDPDEAWFLTRAAEALADVAAVLPDSQKYDALIVDEAQDLTDDWLTALLLLLRAPDEGPVLLLLDNHQEIYRSALTLPSTWPVVELEKNCRNALPIAKRVAACFGDPTPLEGAAGPALRFIEAEDADLADAVHDVVRRLLTDEKLDARQVVVLSNVRQTSARLRTKLVGPAAFVELGRSGVVAETVHRYKGLEAEVVVLAWSGQPSRTSETADRALAYVGASRAKSALFIVASAKWLKWFRSLT